MRLKPLIFAQSELAGPLRRFALSISVSLLLGGAVWADTESGAFKEATEEDNSPSCFGYQLRFANGNVTDNGDGTCSIADQTGLPGGSDVGDVGDCASGACFTSGGDGRILTFDGVGGAHVRFYYDNTVAHDFILEDDLNIEEPTPHLRLTDTDVGHDDFEIYAQSSRTYLTNVTDGTVLYFFNDANRLYLPQLASCQYGVATDALGGTFCVSASAGSTAWDDLGDPDADTTIALGGYETLFTSTLDEAAHYVVKIDNSDVNLDNETTLLGLEYTDDADTDGVFIKALDNNGDLMWQLGANGRMVIGPGATDYALPTARGSQYQVLMDNGAGAVNFTTLSDASVTDALTINNGTGVTTTGTVQGEEVIISSATPTLELQDTAGDSFEWWSDASRVHLSNKTDDRQLLFFNDANRLYVPQLASCASGIATDALGGTSCAPDTATLASTVTVVDSTDATSFPTMVDSATGDLAIKTDAGLTYNATTGTLASTQLTVGGRYKIVGSVSQLNAAITDFEASNGGTIHVSSGYYNLSSGIVLPCQTSIILEGDGHGTFLIPDAGIDSITVAKADGTNCWQQQVLRDFYIVGSATDEGDAFDSGVGITFNNVSNALVDNVLIEKGTTGVLIHTVNAASERSSVNNIFRGLYVSHPETYSVRLLQDNNGDGNYTNQNLFSDFWFVASTTVLDMTNSDATDIKMAGNQFINGRIETSTATDVMLNMVNADSNNFINVNFDGVAGNNQVLLDAASDSNAFTDVSFDGTVVDSGTLNGFMTASTLALKGSIAVPEIANTAGALKIEPDAQGAVTLFGDTQVGNTTDGKLFTVNRLAAEGNDSLSLYVDQYRIAKIQGSSGTDIFIEPTGGGDIVYNMSGGGAFDIGNPDSPGNQVFRHYGVVAGGNHYIQYQVDDATDKYLLTRSNAAITEFSIGFNASINEDLTLGDGSSTALITFNNDAGTDGTLGWDHTNDQIDTNADIEISEATPTLNLTDSTASQDDFELWADNSRLFLSNATDGNQLLFFSDTNIPYFPALANCDTIDTDALGQMKCGSDSTGAGGGDAITVATVAASDPDFIDGTTIDVTLNAVPNPDTIAWEVAADSIGAGQLADADLGDFTCADGGGGCLVDADAVALTTDTTGNYVASVATTATTSGLTGGAAGSEGAAISLGLDYTNTLAGNPTLVASQATFASTGIIFEGATADTYETLLTADDPTAAIGDKTITLPNASGTVAVSATSPATLSATGDIGVTVLKDIVAGAGLSGGADDVLPGADADTTLTLDLTELTTATFGAAAGFTTLTLDSGATDPYFTGGNGTITLTPGGSDFIVADDLELQDADPHLKLTDTTASQDDFEWWANASQVYLSNTTDDKQLLFFNDANRLYFPQLTSCANGISTDALGGTACVSSGAAAGGGATNINLPIYSAKLSGAYVVFTPTDADACTQGAQIDGGDGNWRLLFDATTDECATWQFILPTNYASDPLLDVMFSMVSGEANEVQFEASIMCVTPTTDTADIGTASFSSVAVGTTTVSATAGESYLQTITLTDDSCAAGDVAFIVLSTDANDGTNDDATGDREVVGVNLRYTGS